MPGDLHVVAGQYRPQQIRREVYVVEYYVRCFFFDRDQRAKQEHDLLHAWHETHIGVLVLENR